MAHTRSGQSDPFNITRRSVCRGVAGVVMSLAIPPSMADTRALPVLYADDRLGRYGFGHGHPFGVDRQAHFVTEAKRQSLLEKVDTRGGRLATREELRRFHTAEYIAKVEAAEAAGQTALDGGDTPVFPEVFAISSYVVGTALQALEAVMDGGVKRTLQPIGGLHHAARTHASGFCVFSDLGVVIETLRSQYRLKRIAYIDIDVHHGDGVFYAFEDVPEVIFADIHQDSRTLFPGTGRADETGQGAARGTKLNIELPPWSGDDAFMSAWRKVEAHLERYKPEMFLLQCGADGLKGDPLAQLEYTPKVHAYAAARLCALANQYAQGRLMAFGGGGYDRVNLAQAWCAVLRAEIDA